MNIRPIRAEDKTSVLNMMRPFYTSEAVMTNGSEDIFEADFSACISESPYLEGYVFENDGKICGYAMLAKSFSTEFGRPCIWIEDLYILPDFRCQGLGSRFLALVRSQYPDAVLRLEAEDSNSHAIHVYEKSGFLRLPYCEMYRLPEDRSEKL